MSSDKYEGNYVFNMDEVNRARNAQIEAGFEAFLSCLNEAIVNLSPDKFDYDVGTVDLRHVELVLPPEIPAWVVDVLRVDGHVWLRDALTRRGWQLVNDEEQIILRVGRPNLVMNCVIMDVSKKKGKELEP